MGHEGHEAVTGATAGVDYREQIAELWSKPCMRLCVPCVCVLIGHESVALHSASPLLHSLCSFLF